MKLFIFDHCPYCVRAMMMTGWKGLNVEWVYLQNQDVDARIRMVGANMVPILEKADGSFMAESLDIVAYLDKLTSDKSLAPAVFSQQIQHFLQESSYYSSRLLFPRNVKVDMPEFQQAEAIAWYTKNKTAMISMSFDDAYAKSANYINGLAHCWPLLDSVSLPSERQYQLSYDDILLFPGLRNLTLVKDLAFPERIRRYIEEVAELTQIKLYDDMAI
ncbi:glutaredoxin [Shewanella mangrovi]|uniref:Glutaredoxin n=1 Tax=Shewanella mangrovi TaxID=1515746 RepID=A0A094JED9_9GAMM|nr:glutaredoxin 2 [Shewanella mangrovi]KFZ36394.1 glutaredoxin [Shewanella mangrovi]